MLYLLLLITFVVIAVEDGQTTDTLLEGDMLLAHDKVGDGLFSSALADPYRRWQGGDVYYKYWDKFTEHERKTLEAAMHEIEENTCVSFHKAEKENVDFINVTRPLSSVCESFVGKKGGPQDMKLHGVCFVRLRLLHELMHALGFIHEHTRSDRDQYITIFEENIVDEAKDIMEMGYAYDSVMQYTEKAFSNNNKKTMMAKFPGVKLGPQGNKLSPIDIYRINLLYGCYSESEKISLKPKLLYSLEDQGSQSSKNCSKWVTVKDGDTCGSLANSNDLKVSDILENNPYSNCNHLKVGEKLCIHRDNSKSDISRKQPYIIAAGNDCDKIRQAHNLSQEQFNQMNKYLDCKSLTLGSKIYVLLKESPTTEATSFTTKKIQSIITMKENIFDVGFNFQQGDDGIVWANGCDFYGNTFDQKQMQPQSCRNFCAENPKCSHFTWLPWSNGTCYLKVEFALNTRPQKSESRSVCGYKGTHKNNGSWKQGEEGVWWSNTSDFLWPNATVPYEICEEYTDLEKQKIREAMDEIEEKTCVTFHEAKESDHDRIRILKYGTWLSLVGRQGGTQDLLLGFDFPTSRTILQQLMYTLGFNEEHNRPDRDEYVDIIWDNIAPEFLPYFEKKKLEDLIVMDTQYSYNSIMHYPNDAFAKMNGQTTIVAKKMTNIMGSDHLTDIDVKRIRKLYCRERTPPPLSTIIGGFKFQQGNGKMMLSNACYFHGRDIGRKKSSKAEDCADYCSRTPKCSHFTWNQYHGSDCCLKAGLVPNARPHTAEWDYVCGYKRSSRSEGSWIQGEQGVWWHISPDFRWPNATVPYEKSHAYTDSENQIIRDAMDEIQNKTCVRFREAKESDHDRIRIVKDGVCLSLVGRQGGTQDLLLDRPDRDEYVDIIWSNIAPGYFRYFAKENLEDLTLMDTPYSYSSIMHGMSHEYAYVEDQPTIVAKKPTENMVGGDHLSDIDITRIRKLYCS